MLLALLPPRDGLAWVLPLWGSQASLKINLNHRALGAGPVRLMGAGSQGNHWMPGSKAVTTQHPGLRLEEENRGTSGRAAQI